METGHQNPVFILLNEKQIFQSTNCQPDGKNCFQMIPDSESIIVAVPYRELNDYSDERYEFQAFVEGAVIAVHTTSEGKKNISTRKTFNADNTRWNSREFKYLFEECGGDQTPDTFGVYIMAHPELSCVANDKLEPHLIDLNGLVDKPYHYGDPAGIYSPTILSRDEARQRLTNGDNVVAVDRITKNFVVLISDIYNYRKTIRGNQSVLTGFFNFAGDKVQNEPTQRFFLNCLDPYHQIEYANLKERVDAIITEFESAQADSDFMEVVPKNHDIHFATQWLLQSGVFYKVYNDIRKRRHSYQRRMTLGEKVGLTE